MTGGCCAKERKTVAFPRHVLLVPRGLDQPQGMLFKVAKPALFH
jgi:hypothetical protein